MPTNEIRYFDEAAITVKAGNGGDGIVAFRHEKFVPAGGPSGGDGGRGGSVYVICDPTLNTLYVFQHKRKFNAGDGKSGGAKNMSGKSGDDLEIKVPPGTVVRDAETGDAIGDITEKGQRLLIAKGGKGGRGNQHFATSRNQAPRIADRGEPGETRALKLELKLIADIGIIGAPNAGKSTFLAAVSAAKPKIADYPFTTLTPNLGVADLGEYSTVVLADIPGLIEGAHLGAGLGFAFLRHIQRTRVLIHLLDGLSPNPVGDFGQIFSELSLFDEHLLEKPMIVALNKMDVPEAGAKWDSVKKEIERRGYEIMAISAAGRLGTRDLLNRATQLLADSPPPPAFEAMPVYRPVPDPEAFELHREAEGVWRVTGQKIERAAQMTYWEYDDSARRFQKILEALGIRTALSEAGVKEGDTVIIGEAELEWTD
ncbi:MAG TPA: GTPase ObgE [Anaerolineales bacterium]|nr:GTPase ObgE [Anaerolineales bacterium]